MDRTDPRWVVAQIDIGWAVCGSAFGTPPDAAAGMAYVTAMINKFTNRVVSYHFKDVDAAGIRLNCGNAEQREIGQGGINFAPMIAAAKNRSKYYFMERDPVAVGGPTNFNPFTNTENSMKAMRADPAPTLFAAAPVFTSVAGRHARRRPTQVPVVVTNDGDAPLTITNITVAADALDGGNTTARRLRDRQPELLRHRQRRPAGAAQARRGRRPDDAGVNEASRGRPVRDLHRQRRLQADAHRLHVGRPPAVHVELRRRASSACCSPPRAPATRSPPSAATSRACSR